MMRNNFFFIIFKKISPILFFLLFLIWPFLVIQKTIKVISPNENVLLSGEYSNFFTYYRLVFWVIITIILLLIFFLRILFTKIKIRFNIAYLLLIFFGFWIILSAILSPYNEAYFGIYDRTRGAFAYLVGIIYAFLVSFYLKYKQEKIIIFYGFSICTLIITIFSILQFFGFDPFLEFPLKYITGIDKSIIINYLNFTTFGGLYNKNVLGSYQIVALIIFVVLFLKYKNKLYTIIYFIISLLIFFSLVSTSTRGAWIPLVIFLILYFIIHKDKPFLKLFFLIVSFVSIFVVMDYYSGHSFFKNLFETSIVSVILILFIGFIFIIVKKYFPNISKILLFSTIFIVIIGSIFIFSIFNPFKNNTKIMTFGSGRIYIFWRVNELVLKNPIFGLGPETLLFYLNIEDPYRYKYLRSEYIDKSHSFYFGLASDSGIPALLIFIFLCVIVLNALWKYRKNIYAETVFWALVGYLIQGLSFDAFICTDIILFTLLGIGIYYTIKEDHQESILDNN